MIRWSTSWRCRRRIMCFCRGIAIMVQVQSSWFPLYDRNPQTFVREYLLCEAGGL